MAAMVERAFPSSRLFTKTNVRRFGPAVLPFRLKKPDRRWKPADEKPADDQENSKINDGVELLGGGSTDQPTHAYVAGFTFLISLTFLPVLPNHT